MHVLAKELIYYGYINVRRNRENNPKTQITKKEIKQYKQKRTIQKAKTRTAKIIDALVLSVHGKLLML